MNKSKPKLKSEEECKYCDGTGSYSVVEQVSFTTDFGPIVHYRGKPKIVEKPCSRCNGKGFVEPQPKEGWEEEFDRKFTETYDWWLTDYERDNKTLRKGYATPSAVKDFISQLLKKQRKEMIEEMRVNFHHPEFCFKKGKQFIKCVQCILDEKLKEEMGG